jgi:ribosomal-protein-alanine N-acetyltransferase
MELEDIPQVLEVDRESYTLPWPASAYRREILHNRNARYVVLRRLPDDVDVIPASAHEEQRPRVTLPFFRWPLKASESRSSRSGDIIGYAGMWVMVDEAHITTIAVQTRWRGRGHGELLLASLIEAAIAINAARITLEVRVSNETAQRLYRKYGFHQEGTRPRYYSDNNEDAYIMTTDSVRSVQYLDRFHALVEALKQRLDREDLLVTAPPFAHARDKEPATGE